MQFLGPTNIVSFEEILFKLFMVILSYVTKKNRLVCEKKATMSIDLVPMIGKNKNGFKKDK